MKQTLRLNTFETNSSSTHSCCLCSEEEFKNWQEGKSYFIRWNSDDKVFISKEEVEQEWLKFKQTEDYKESLEYNENEEDEVYNNWLSDNDYTSYEDFGYEYETDVTQRKIGDQIFFAVCYYGQDY